MAPAYQVFLSFRGETRKTFTDHLYSALRQTGIRTFRDEDELPRGKEISLELRKAIQESQVSIIVFSKNYASSRWCLDELVDILENKRKMGQLVLPVFYDVDPSEVRHQTGRFAEAFACHEKRYAAEIGKVQRWRAALAEAANLSGWDVRNVANGHESKVIKKIVEKVSREVWPEYLEVAEFPIGIDPRVEDINRLLSMESDDVRFIGIYGRAGIGKTTLARAVHNSILQHFECIGFVENVQNSSEWPNGLVSLQKKLLSKMLKRENFKIDNVDHGIDLIQRLRPKKVLIVLDDVNMLSQVNSLVGHRSWFGLGSRIILTTTDVHLLNQVQVDARYKVEELNFDQALELFSLYAFRKTIPLEDYMELSRSIVAYTGGLPIALLVLACALFGRRKEEWKSSFEMLRKLIPKEIQKRLVLGYDALDDNAKDIFLDIACFFIGMHKDYAINILKGCGFFPEIGISTLTDRRLLTINERNELRMHDLLRDRGREIVRGESGKEPGKRSRLWSHEDIMDVLKHDKGTEAVEGISLERYSSEPVRLSTKPFERMRKLRLLRLDNARLDGSFEHLSQELRWLRMRHSHFECLPPDFNLEKLVVLDMQYSKLDRVWKGIKDLGNLKLLNLSHSINLTSTPDFTNATNVQTLLLEGCTSLMELHPSIGLLNNMLSLNLKECKNLRDLPSSICNLSSLESLDISGCSKLELLPEHFGNMESLQQLSADRTAIRHLPDSIGFMKNLKSLSLQGRNATVPAKSWLSRIFSWTVPDIVSFIPPSISGLSSLTRLNLDCSNLSEKDLPSDLGSLSSLEQLNLGGNNFRRLPFSLTQLVNLEVLWLSSCSSLESLPELPPSDLISLHADGCTSMVALPNLSNLQRLEELHLTNCSRLAEIWGLENLNSIRKINMEGCSSLATTFEQSVFQQYCERGVSFNVVLPRKEIPCWISHRSWGSSICFNMPVDKFNNFIGILLWVIYSKEIETVTEESVGHVSVIDESIVDDPMSAIIKNKSSGGKWTYFGYCGFQPCTTGVHSWVSFIPGLYKMMSSGDIIEIFIRAEKSVKVVRCGFHLSSARL